MRCGFDEMRIIAVTGKKAESMLRKEIARWRAQNQSEHDCEIITQDIEIAAFTTPETLKRALKNLLSESAANDTANDAANDAANEAVEDRTSAVEADEAGTGCGGSRGDEDECETLRKYLANCDLILVSGLCKADFRDLERDIGVPIRLGPRDVRDIADVLEYAAEIEFSRSVPADVFLRNRRREHASEMLRSLESAASASFSVKGVKIGGNSRMKVCAEIVDATLLSEDEIRRIMQKYLKSGADIIDIGVHIGASPDDVERAVKAALSCDPSVPISVDTTDADLIIAAIEAGADMVLSLNSDNMKKVGENVADAGVVAVVIPDLTASCNECGNECGNECSSVESLLRNIQSAREMHIEIIADPVLNAPGYGLASSLHNYFVFRQYDRDTPLFLGVGNVTELIDADSVGVNAILAAIASELRASVLFTTEHSDKCAGSVRELRTAAEMMMVASGGPPKDVGIDLLVLKEKRRRKEREIEVCSKNANAECNSDIIVIAHENESWHIDPFGCFRIEICETPYGRRILAEHEPSGKKIVGKTAKEILDTILRLGLVSLMEHAAYLGRELAKAEIAMKIGRSYGQDEPLF